MRSGQEGKPNQAAEVPGGLRKTFGVLWGMMTKDSSTNSSSPTGSPSSSISGNGTEPKKMHVTVGEKHVSSSSSVVVAGPYDSDSREMTREFTLTLHLSTNGKRIHVHKAVVSIIRILLVKGVNILQITLDGEDVSEKYHDWQGRSIFNPKFNGWNNEDG